MALLCPLRSLNTKEPSSEARWWPDPDSPHARRERKKPEVTPYRLRDAREPKRKTPPRLVIELEPELYRRMAETFPAGKRRQVFTYMLWQIILMKKDEPERFQAWIGRVLDTTSAARPRAFDELTGETEPPIRYDQSQTVTFIFKFPFVFI